MAKEVTEGLFERLTRVAINWPSWMLLGIWLTVGVVAGLAFDSVGVRERLPLVLLALAVGIAVASPVLSRFCTRRCASCDSSPADLAWHLDDCPNCHRPHYRVTDLLAGRSVLSLRECLTNRSLPQVNAFGIVLMLAIRDGASRIRLVGHKVNDGAEYPWSTPCGSWSIWINVKETDHEMVTPPRHVAAGMFEILRETYRKAEKETPNGPARLPVALDDWSEDVQLVIEESEKEQVASIIFPSGLREPVRGADSCLREFYSPPSDNCATGFLPPATTWKRLPQFISMIPRWILIGINSIAASLAIVSFITLLLLAHMSAQSASFVVMTASCIVVLVGASLLTIRRECRCGALLAQWFDDHFAIWCPECRSVFDPSKRGLPMDGATLRLNDLRKCRDPHALWLVPLLDYALDCRKEQVAFIGGEGDVAAHLSKADTDTVELQLIDSCLCLELMAEFDRRARKKSGNVAAFRIVGSFREASATLELSESDGKRVATLNLAYRTTGRS